MKLNELDRLAELCGLDRQVISEGDTKKSDVQSIKKKMKSNLSSLYKQEIKLRKAWADSYVEIAALESYIMYLQKAGNNPDLEISPKIIKKIMETEISDIIDGNKIDRASMLVSAQPKKIIKKYI